MAVPREIEARLAKARSFVVFAHPTGRSRASSPEWERCRDDHLRWLLRLEEEGTLLVAGPLLDAPDDAAPDASSARGDAEGMYVLVVDSLERARSLADADPLVSAGWRSHHIRPWILNEGRAATLARDMASCRR